MQSPYLTQEEAAAYARIDSLTTFRRWEEKVGLQRKKVLSKVLYRIDDLDRAIELGWQRSKSAVKAGNSTGRKAVDNIVNPLAKYQRPKRNERKRTRN